MRDTTLPSPGVLAQGHNLRRTAAAAISAIEITARRTPGGKTLGARQLSDFFTACAASLSTLVDSVLATVVSRVRTGVNTATVTMSEALDPSTSVPLSCFVFSPSRVVTAVVVTGSTIVVTATGVIATDTITYTPPAAPVPASAEDGRKHLGVKDLAGNPIATFTGILA